MAAPHAHTCIHWLTKKTLSKNFFNLKGNITSPFYYWYWQLKFQVQVLTDHQDSLDWTTGLRRSIPVSYSRLSPFLNFTQITISIYHCIHNYRETDSKFAYLHGYLTCASIKWHVHCWVWKMFMKEIIRAILQKGNGNELNIQCTHGDNLLQQNSYDTT